MQEILHLVIDIYRQLYHNIAVSVLYRFKRGPSNEVDGA